MNRLASLLAVVAVLAVLGSTVAAVAAFQERDVAVAGGDPSGASSGTTSGQSPAATGAASPSAPSVVTATPFGVFADEQVIAGDLVENATFEVPSTAEGWSVQSSDTTLYYADAEGMAVVGVAGPAVLDDGFCPGNSFSNRGFAGLTKSAEGDDVRTANTTLAQEWVDAIALDTDTGRSTDHTPIDTRDFPLSSGEVAVRSDSVIDTVPGKCAPPRISFTILSLDTGDAIANLVVVRDLGVSGAMSKATAEKILGTLQAQVPGE